MQILINSPQINSFKFCFCSDAPASQGLRFASVYFGLAFHWISNYHPHHPLQCKLNNDGTVVVGVERRTDDEDKVHKPQMFVEVDLVVDGEGAEGGVLVLGDAFTESLSLLSGCRTSVGAKLRMPSQGQRARKGETRKCQFLFETKCHLHFI